MLYYWHVEELPLLALTKKVDYGLIALSHMALHRQRVVTARDLAERYHLPPALLMNILKTLAQRGMVRSSRGPRGGYELVIEPDAITLDEIITAIEGPVRLVQCLDAEHAAPSERCDLACKCPISGPVRRLHRKLKEFLGEVTLAQIACDAEFGVPMAAPAVALALACRESAT